MSTETPRPGLTPQQRASLERGLAQSAAGEVYDLGSFAEYAESPTPERVTLSEVERTQLVAHMWGRHVSTNVDLLVTEFAPAVERILAAREQALREEIAGDAALSALGSKESPETVVAMLMDAADRMDNPQHKGNQHRWPEHAAMFHNFAGAIARGGPR